MIPDFTMYQAIIICLITWIPKLQSSSDGNETVYRTQPEQHALVILDSFLPCKIEYALIAGLVRRWLAPYLFSKYGPSKRKTQKVMHRLTNWEHDDNLMCQIINSIRSHDEGEYQMYIYGLVDNVHKRPKIAESIEDLWFVGNQGLDGEQDLGIGPMMRRGHRVREESIEEHALRRRRRMATVLGQEGRPLQRADLIEQGDEVLTEQRQEVIDAEIVELIEEDPAAGTRGDQSGMLWEIWSYLASRTQNTDARSAEGSID